MADKNEKKEVLSKTFLQFDIGSKGFLTPLELQALYSDIRMGSLSVAQIQASVECATITGMCEPEDLFDVLKEMDRRYFLVQDFKWEFTMLDTQEQDAITENQAKWFLQTVHGAFFSNLKWERFIRRRNVPGSCVSFQEIEVMLCNIPRKEDLEEEEEEAKRDREEAMRKKQEMEKRLQEEKEKRKRQREEERRRREEEERLKREAAERRRREEEEERRQRQRQKEEEERRKRELLEQQARQKAEDDEKAKRAQEEVDARKRAEIEAAMRDEEQRRLRDEREANDDERVFQDALRAEKEAKEEAARQAARRSQTDDDLTQRDARAAEERARRRGIEMKNKRIRFNLKVAVKRRDRDRLPPAVKDFKDAQLPDDDKDLEKAEQILREWLAGDGLMDAMGKRQLKELEQAIAYIKRNGFEGLFEVELIEAQKILLQLRRLERIRAEILELKQSTVAEIRSYQKPPAAVHTVMVATFLTLGHLEREARQWKNVQSLVGKTGKEGVKRRCLELEPKTIDPEKAARAKQLLAEVDLDDIRDVSAAAATFFVWSISMIDEMESQANAKRFEEEQIKKKKEEKRKAEERRKQIANEELEREKSMLQEDDAEEAAGPTPSSLLASKAGNAKVTMGDVEKLTDFNMKIKSMNKVQSKKITEVVTGMKVVKESDPVYDDRKGVKHYDLELETEEGKSVRKIVKTIKSDDNVPKT